MPRVGISAINSRWDTTPGWQTTSKGPSPTEKNERPLVAYVVGVATARYAAHRFET